MAEVTVSIEDPGGDVDDLDRLRADLRAELLDLDVIEVKPLRRGTAPPGSRAIDVTAIGSLVVLLQSSVQLITQITVQIRGWLGRSGAESRNVELRVGDNQIRLSGASSEQQDLLVDEFLESVRRGEQT